MFWTCVKSLRLQDTDEISCTQVDRFKNRDDVRFVYGVMMQVTSFRKSVSGACLKISYGDDEM